MLKYGEISLDSMFVNADYDALLDARNSSKQFGTQLESALEEIERIRFIVNTSSETDALRECCFNAVFNSTEHYDLSACVSADFGLIGAAGFYALHKSCSGYTNNTISGCGRIICLADSPFRR